LLGGAATLASVALDAGADQVLPAVAATERAGQNVVDGKLAGGEVPAAVLAGIAVAGEEVPAVEFDGLGREAVVAHEADDARDCDLQTDGANPVVLLGLEAALVLRELGPAAKRVRVVLAVFNLDHFSQVGEQHGEGPPRRDDADGHVQLVEDQDLAVERVGQRDRR